MIFETISEDECRFVFNGVDKNGVGFTPAFTQCRGSISEARQVEMIEFIVTGSTEEGGQVFVAISAWPLKCEMK